jgi:hypothetical protein
MISRFLRLLTLPAEVQHLVDWGQSGATIAFTAASELSRLRRPEDQIDACHAALEKQLSSSEIKQLVQLSLRSKRRIQDCVGDVLRLRDSIQKVHVFAGAITSEDLRGHLSKLTQSQRDALLTGALGKTYPELAGVASRLGSGRFTIIGRDALAEEINKVREELEPTLNLALAQAVER